MYLNNMPASTGEIGLNGLLYSTISIVKHNGNISLIEFSFCEAPCDVLEDDSSCSGGIIDDGDFVEVLGIDEALEEGAGAENAGFEVGEVEVIGLAKELELEVLLGVGNGGRATTKGAIVDASYGGVVVAEF